MTSIDNIILQSTNPFDNYRSVNFWQPQNSQEALVDSIHQDEIATIEETLDLVAEDHNTRTILLEGNPGAGKTYLLGRLKKKLNYKAFFVYIQPFPQSDRIWRHVLRYTVNSMVKVPEGQEDSQLMIWLKSLSVFTQRSLKQRIFKDNFWELLTSDRKKFTKHLTEAYRTENIYNADSFFSVLHDLTDPKLYTSACQWLQGDDLSEESLKELGVKKSIDSEETAYETLSNFGKISAETKPIVLCFDQVQSIARLPNGSLDLPTLLTVNSKIHDENNNFFVLLSITTDTWRQYTNSIEQCHKDRIDKTVYLKPINLKQAESILASRLFSIYLQANPKPNSQIYPLNTQLVEQEFQRSRTTPREALMFGRDIFQEYKKWLVNGKQGEFNPSDSKKSEKDDRAELLANFKLKWLDEFTKNQQKITQVSQESSSELIQMLKEALAALQMEEIKTPLLTGTKFASYSLAYQIPGKSGRIGIVWTEDQNLTTFFYVMEACRKAVEKNLCQNLYLIREAGVGNSNNKGHKIYKQVFKGKHQVHIIPDVTSVQYLVTYYDFIKDAREGDLYVRGETIGLKQLQSLIRELEILHDCPLLQNLEIVPSRKAIDKIDSVKDFLLNLIITQQFLGRQTLIENAHSQFHIVDKEKIERTIDELCQENKTTIINPDVPIVEQLVCLVPEKISNQPINLDEIWQKVLIYIKPKSIQVLLRQLCCLEDFTDGTATIGVRVGSKSSKSWLDNIQEKVPNIQAAFQEALNLQVKVILIAIAVKRKSKSE